jgi:anti-sigma factor RsiW
VSRPDARTVDLIQRDLDGDLSATERAELARQLLAEPEARRLRDELARTDARLRAVPPAEPPVGLRPAILKALNLPADREGTGDGAPGGWSGFRLAAALLGGLVVVGLGYRLVGTGEDLGGLRGSIAEHAAPTVPADEAALPAAGGTVTARLFHEGGQTRLVIESSALEPVEVVGRYAASPPAPGLAPQPGEAPGQFSVVLQAGRTSETLEFAGTGAVRLEVRAGGQQAGAAVLGPDQ